jgi:hypothetical protein
VVKYAAEAQDLTGSFAKIGGCTNYRPLAGSATGYWCDGNVTPTTA